jgi:hypothetical protein
MPIKMTNGSKLRRRRRKRGRPATGHDRVVALRLPTKLVREIDQWASGYRDEFQGMNQSTAIRCLILLGLQAVASRVVDLEHKRTFEAPTPPLLKFYGRMVRKWDPEGTGKMAKRNPPIVHRPTRRPPQPTPDQIKAAADRAEARSKANKTRAA